MIGYIYRLDFASGKSYIGATIQPLAQRIRRHKAAALNNQGQTFEVHRAWIEFGDPEVVLLAEVDRDDLAQTEIDAISKFGTLSPGGYNLTTGGRKTKFHADSNARKSAAFKGRTFSDETIRRMSAAQAFRDPDSRPDLSQYWTGKKQSKNHVDKRIRPKGWKHSDEVKRKVSAANKGRVVPEELRARISASMKLARQRKNWSTKSKI